MVVAKHTIALDQKGTFSMPSSRSASRLSVTFDDDHAVADAGLALVAVLSEKLGLEALVAELVDVHPFPGRRVATLVHAMVAGANFIDDADILRSGAAAAVLGHKVMAPSTLGTFLRRFSFGHVRQLDKVAEAMLTNAWSLGAGPGGEPMTLDVDSTICPVHGDDKEGAGFGYTKVLGYHPLVATRAATGEVLHIRFRKGSAHSGRGAERFVRELVGRARRAGSSGPLTLRADSGFYSQHVVKACRDHKVAYSITAPQNAAVKRAIEGIAEDVWAPIDYSEGGAAWVAETPYGDGHRLVVRRTKLASPQPALFPLFRYHAFITDRVGDAVTLDADHRRHAVVELAIKDLKDGGLAHCPSGNFSANGAWAVLATIAHNLIRWVGALGLEISGPLVGKTIRRRFLALPGRITRRSRRRRLHLPTFWPWAKQWTACFDRLRALQT
jgi:Transposase DDE domain group 1